MGGCIIDIGGSKNKYYEIWLKKYSLIKIYCYEPHPTTYKNLLLLKDSLNIGCSSRLFIINKAVSDSEGIKRFNLNNDASSSSLLSFDTSNILKWKYPIGRRAFKTIDTIDVECITLSQIFKENKINMCELLIIDTQGDAFNVLKTLTYDESNKIKSIIVKVQTCDFNIYEDQCAPYDVAKYLKKKYFEIQRCKDVSRCQEQLMYFINSMIKNRKVPLLDLQGLD
jgi:FkbM family methyltransferase